LGVAAVLLMLAYERLVRQLGDVVANNTEAVTRLVDMTCDNSALLAAHDRRQQHIDGLDEPMGPADGGEGGVPSPDGEPPTWGTVPVEHEALLVIGAAGWASELHYRQAADAVGGPSPEQIKRMYSWGYLRLQDFRRGLSDLARVPGGQVVQPVWGRMGL
jgi:hypothetical protein